MIGPATALDPAAGNGNGNGNGEEPGALDVFRNRNFLLLWLSQVFTQVGGNMVLFGLTIIVKDSTHSNAAVSLMFVTFLAPAVLLSAVAGVYVDRLDKRWVLVGTNVSRAFMLLALWFLRDVFIVLLLLNALVATLTVFFAPAEASMIPQLVPRKQLVSANGIFTLTLNAAFAIGYALLGGIVVSLAGAPGLLIVVAIFYLIAAMFCWWLPPSPPVIAERSSATGSAETDEPGSSTFGQLREGIGYIRANRAIGWSLIYLGIAASLIGVLGVLGQDLAQSVLGLEPKDLGVVVLPLGFGIMTGILILNSWGHLAPRRRIIEGGLIALGIFVGVIVSVVPVARFIKNLETAAGLQSVADFTSLLSIVVFMALLAGVAYAFVAIPSQTQLQEEIPEDVRGRVFGVLNMLVSTASVLPIIIVGPLADVIGTTNVLYLVSVSITASGIVSIVRRGPLKPAEAKATAVGPARPSGLDPVAVAVATELDVAGRRESRRRAEGAAAAAAAAAAAVEPSATVEPSAPDNEAGVTKPDAPTSDPDQPSTP